MALATLDLSLFTKGGDLERRQFATDLLSSLTTHGFVKIVKHGFADEDVSKLWEMNKAFFQLPIEEKAKIVHVPGPNPQRGWSTVGAESTAKLYRKGLLKSEVNDNLKDAREHFDVGSANDHQYKNKFPSEDSLPGFQTHVEGAFERLETISSQLMEALEVACQLPHGTFLNRITSAANASEFRFNHYPAIDVKEIRGGKVSRIWPHFDLGVITLLFQDHVGGLEFENRASNGSFTRIECGSSSDLIVNVSETLQRWSNGCIRAGLHRVALPEELEGSQAGIVPERYSMAYFCKADREASVGALKEFVPENTQPVFEDMSAIEYQKQRLLSAY